MNVVNIGFDGFAKQLLTGFWYTDPYRIGSCLVFSAIPLASLGLCAIFGAVIQIVSRFLSRADFQKRIYATVAVAIAAVFVFFNGLFPSISLSGGYEGDNAFAVEGRYLKEGYSDLCCFDEEEKAFVEKVKSVVPEGATIVNMPYDGSAFAYAFQGLDVYYRYWGGYGGRSETLESRLIRENLSSVADREDVLRALEKMGIQYAILLDAGRIDSGGISTHTFDERQWVGVESVTDDTLGFEVVLAEGDMRLYRIAV